MKNKDFYSRVAENKGYDLKLVEFFANNLFKGIRNQLYQKQFFAIKLGGLFNIELSLGRVNNVIRHKYLKALRNDPSDEDIEKFRNIWELRQRLIEHNRSFKKNRPKRWVTKKRS